MVTEMDRLLDNYNYADTARILNEKGFRTGDGLPVTSIAVGYVRKAYGLKSRFDRLRERGMLTISEMAKACGVSINTIGHWRKKGLLPAHAINDRTQFLFEDPELNPPKKHSRKVSNSGVMHVPSPDFRSGGPGDKQSLATGRNYVAPEAVSRPTPAKVRDGETTGQCRK
jgi:MerR HTH family regulatory protein